MTDHDRKLLRSCMKRRAENHPNEDVHSYYADVCKRMRDQGRMTAGEMDECLRIIGGKRQQPSEQQQMELFE